MSVPEDPRIEPELARALDALRPAPRSGFRQELRARFLAGRASTGPTPGGDADLAPALDAWRPQARSGFRDELQERFLAGPGRRWRWLAGGGAALLAAAALLVWLAWPWLAGAGDAPGWRLDPTSFTAGSVAVDGTVLEDPERAGVRLAGAGTVSLASEAPPLRLVYGDLFVVELDSDSTLDLARLADPAAGEPLVLAAEHGAFRFATGPGFPGRSLRFEAPDAVVEVVGTVFGVDCYADLTCVCVYEGAVTTRPRRDGLLPLDGPGTVLFPRDGAPEREPSAYEPHQVPLRSLAGFWDSWRP